MFNWLTENPTLLNTVSIVVVVAAAWLLGAWIAAAVRMKDYGWKFGCILFAVFASAVIIYRGWPPKLGIDLGGGAVLVYRVDHTQTDWRPDKLESLVAAISNRVNPGGQKEISVRGLGSDMVQIIMPAVSGATAKEKQAQLQEIKDIIQRTGALEFRILATRRFDQTLIERAAAARKAACLKNPNTDDERVVYSDKIDPYTGKRKERAKWCRVRDNKKEQDSLRNNDAAIEVYDGKDKEGKDKEGKDKYRLEVLVLAPDSEATDVTGKYIRDARASQSTESGGWEVEFTFNAEGGAKFGKLTGEHTPLDDGAFKFKLAIVLDNVLQSAPDLISAINERGRITGEFSEKEVTELADIINRGSLPAALNPNPEREMVTEATLGADTIRQSFVAMAIAAIVVPLFMIYYYRFAGVIAVIVLSITILMLVAIMILVKAPFTLTALAGLALSVGMEVDNNVLIYERLREEIRHGAALRMALRNSFHRVGVVIVDANITHILAAGVLFYVGTEQVKGFAITFLLGALLSIWATMFVAKTLFEVAERRFRITQIHMMQWIGHTTIDFMHWFKACATFSVLITVLGLAVAFVRGKGLFDIDFTGGISVQTIFREDEQVKTIRDAIAQHEKELPDATVTPVHSGNEPANRRFVIDTSNTNGKFVEDLIQKLFEGQLVTASMNYEVGPAESKSTPAEASPGSVIEKPPAKPETVAPRTTAPNHEPRPAEPPRDMSAPEATPPAPKSTAAPPATTPPAPKPSAAAPKQSRVDAPAADLLANIEPEEVIYTMFDVSAGTADAKPQATGAMTHDTAAMTHSTAAMTLVTPAKPLGTATKTETKAESKTPEKPAPKSELKADAKTESKPFSEMTPEQSVQANLTFSVSMARMEGEKLVNQPQEAKYDKNQLEALIVQALEAHKIPAKSVQINLTNSAGAEAADQWTVTLAPLPGAKIALTPDTVKDILKNVQAEANKQPYFPGIDNMGSAVATDTRFWACVALVLSWSLIILYLWIRFQGVAFGLAAVIALIHDVLVMLGAIAFSSYLARIPGMTALTLIEPFKINLTIVAAFLTIIGYSVNDTIVVFDRIREIRGKSPALTRQMVNDATNQTLSRTVLTSFTVLLVVLILYVFGGQAVHGFAFALFIGVLTGTYSSIYVAAPILLWLLHPTEMRR